MDRRATGEGRPLAPRTAELYRWLLDKHGDGYLGDIQLRHLSKTDARAMLAGLRSACAPGEITAAKCYRLVRAICNTAVREEQMATNPCTIPGAGLEATQDRPVITIEQVMQLAHAVGERWRCAVLLATFCGLRFGEIAALTRERIDLDAATVSVVASVAYLPGGQKLVGPPKSEAGRRTIAIPAVILDDLEVHLSRFTPAGARAPLFVGPRGGELRSPHFTSRIWHPALETVGLAGLHFHDLRHTGNTLAAATGASLKELMSSMGHATPDAALNYQHATHVRDQAIADALTATVRGSSAQRPQRDSSRMPLRRSPDNDGPGLTRRPVRASSR